LLSITFSNAGRRILPIDRILTEIQSVKREKNGVHR
jgi:hypothetical protein